MTRARAPKNRRLLRRRAPRVATLALALSTSIVSGADDGPRVTALEVVTTKAAVGDGGNAWGGHQCRIVRTRHGVFTAYTVDGRDDMSREWRLAWRRAGRWDIVASGLAGREPANLLASPDGALHIIAWPGGRAHIWSGKPAGTALEMQRQPVPALNEDHWAYGSAGMDRDGRIYVLSSEGESPGAFRWSSRAAAGGPWTSATVPLDYRHCYTYVLPGLNGSLSLVSTRDVKWETLGYVHPFGQFDYVRDSLGLWHSPDIQTKPLRKAASIEEKPSRRHPDVLLTAQIDALLDTKGRIHILYTRRGPGTGGDEELRYAIFQPDGNRLRDEKVPWSAGPFCRVFQDERAQFYLLGSDGVIYGGGSDGISFSSKTKLKLGRNQVEYSGFGISAPRTGTPPANVIDVVFPSAGGAKWIYFRVLLHGHE
jgi:hypothetical protein